MFALECAVYVGGIRLESLPGGPHFCDAFAFESQQKETHGAWIPRSLDDVDMPNHKIAVAQEVFDLDPPFRGHPVSFRYGLQKRIPSQRTANRDGFRRERASVLPLAPACRQQFFA